MNEISLAFPVYYLKAPKYYPMINQYRDNICKCYGYHYSGSTDVQIKKEDKLSLTALPLQVDFVANKILRKVLRYPEYYSYLCKIKILDIYCAIKISKDNSKILFASPLLWRTVKAAKKANKIVVIEAGNSEPNREYKKISAQYQKYNIKHKYIYGDPVFKNTCNRSMKYADYIVTLSKVSHNTYLDGGYQSDKLKLIPLTGTDFPIQYSFPECRKKAFISTGFHNFIKGTQNLLLAWREARISSIPLILVGRICEDLQEFIDKNGPFDNVIFAGHQSNLQEWYKDYDAVGVLFSLSEGAGRTTPEMMSFGFPMIVSEDATCDLVEDEKNGFVLRDDDLAGLIDKLKWFADDWSRVGALRRNVLLSVKNRKVKDYSLDVAQFLLSLISE